MATRAQVTEIYVATFNRAPDSAGLDYWVYSGLTIDEIAASFFDQPETHKLYPDSLNNVQFVNAIYNNLFNRGAEAAGLHYWVDELDAGTISRDQMIMAVVNGAQGTDDQILANKTEVGLYFADNGENLSYDQSVEVMAGVDVTQASVDAAVQEVDTWNETAIASPTINTVAGDDIVDQGEADAGFAITGTGIVGATVTLAFSSGTTLTGGNTAVVGADGKWSTAVTSADVAVMGEGGESISATQTSTGGVTSAATVRNIIVEADGPTPPPPPPPPPGLEITAGPAIALDATGTETNDISLTVNENAYVTTTGFSSDNEEEFFGGNSDTLQVAAQAAVTYGTINVTDMARVDSLMSDTTVWLGTNNADTIDGNEEANLLFGFQGNDTLHGHGGNDELSGRIGDDILHGDDGDDILYGGANADELYGGNDNDLLVIDDNDTVVDGGSGTDTVKFVADVNMGGDTWSGIETATATADEADLRLSVAQLTGLQTFNGDGTNTDEQLIVYANSDIDVSGITFANGSAATITSWASSNALTGGNGNDTLLGNNGADTLTGGLGADTLTGGADADRFNFTAGDSGTTTATIDKIIDFTHGDSDTISFGDVAGSSATFTKVDGSSTADLAAFLANANAAGSGLGGSIVYYAEYNVGGTGDGYLAYDSTGNGQANEVIELTNFTLNTDLYLADIVA